MDTPVSDGRTCHIEGKSGSYAGRKEIQARRAGRGRVPSRCVGEGQNSSE